MREPRSPTRARPPRSRTRSSRKPRNVARRRRRHEPEEEHENEERWMASYMDMVTVLMCMFIVLFAMSTVDQKKFEQLKDSLATGFGQVKTQKIDTASGVVVPPKQVDETGKNTD